MCGYCGIHCLEDAADLRGPVTAMTETLRHRGPDAGGIFCAPTIALGHRRLSIIDLTSGGAQPMSVARSGLTLAYNGEVYNFRELRQELESRGHTFQSKSDTEVILHCYEQWGMVGLKRLEGIFSLALWDGPSSRLVLMRDRLGVKPLYYAVQGGRIYFGSEIKAVLAGATARNEIDEQAFREYLWYGNTFGDRTFYKGVRALEPGEWLIVERGNIRKETWWNVESLLSLNNSYVDFREGVEAVRVALDQAVERQLVADVPVGIFLSGGLDSSAIAASAARRAGSWVKSYSAGFDYAGGGDELPKAAIVAKHLGLQHREIKIGSQGLEEILLHLAYIHDEPFADAANIPLYLMSKALRGEVKVVLQGDGGDEIFAGYRRYTLLQNVRLLRRLPRIPPWLVRVLGIRGMQVRRITSALQERDASMRMALLMTVEELEASPESILTESRRKDLAQATDPFLIYRTASARFADYEPVQQMLLTDLTVQLPSQFLTKVDRATMAVGVEARVPLLDERLLEVTVGMGSRWKVSGSTHKIILREALRGRLPDSILNAPKSGFGVPYEHWLRTSLYEFCRSRLLDSRFIERFGLSASEIENRLSAHRHSNGRTGFLLWKLLNLQLWSENAAGAL